MNRILVWDLPVRVGHWLLAGGFCLAWLTAESETFRLVHVVSGAVVLGVAGFRLVWGLVGSRHARFGDFVRGPGAVLAYLRSLLARQPEHYAGHNPAGGWAILLLLGLGILSSLSGWGLYNELGGGDALEDVHEALASAMLAVVLVHLAGVVSGSLAHGENLVAAMFSGRKLGLPGEAIPSARPLALVLLLASAAAAGWLIAS